VPEEPSFQAEVGSLYHSIIESINKAKHSGVKIPSYEELLNRLESDWPEVGYLSQAQRTRDLSSSTNNFKDLYSRLVNEPVPIAVEQSFRVHIPDSNCILKGRIDVVMPIDGGVEIHDYKTSTSVTDPEKAKRKTTESKQLTMYALVWRIQTEESAKQVCLDYVRTGQLGIVKKLPRSLDAMQANLAQVADDLKAGNFPQGAKHDYCIHPL
jgi:RecB family exonuclease